MCARAHSWLRYATGSGPAACMNMMTRPAPDNVFAPGPLVLAALIFVAALSRLAVPLLAMLASDLVLVSIMGGSYVTYLGGVSFWTVYACIALSTVLGFGLRGKASAARVLGYSLAGSVLFFAVTNFGAWLGSPGFYPRNAAGLAAAYVAGIPFFKWTVVGTMAYAAFLFGGFALLRRRLPVLRAQTV